MPNRNEVRYEVDIIGDCAPYSWQLYCLTPHVAGRQTRGSKQEADSFTAAQFEAAELAREIEGRRRYDATRETVHLFTAPWKYEREEDEDAPLVAEKPVQEVETKDYFEGHLD